MQAFIAALVIGLSPLFALAATAADATTSDPLAPSEIQNRIRRHRTTDATLTFLRADGKPLANTPSPSAKPATSSSSSPTPSTPTPLTRPTFRRPTSSASPISSTTPPSPFWGSYERTEGHPMPPA